MAIEAVIWDFGGVFTPSPFAAAHAYARAQGTEPDAFVRIVFGDYDADTDHAWHRLERGEIAFTVALDEIGASAVASGVRFDVGEMFGTMVDDEVDRSVVTDYVRALRGRGIRNAILTNNIREYGDHWRARLDVDELFDLVVDSCLEGIRKPDPVIYERALERLGIGPEAAVFLDDFEQNVVAARALGMHGIVVGADPRVALAELDALLA
ncbi:MAG TPA: HAD family phosphatase [Acidimicrobiia bacterium]|nr:HAD family phosphatase [Acidimicrobiia bacterium]